MTFVFTFMLKDAKGLCTRFNPERPEVDSALTAEDSILWHSGIQHHIAMQDRGSCEQQGSILLELINQADKLLSYT